MKDILIVGCGSIGERHLRCFQKTGRARVAACDADPALLSAMGERYQADLQPDFAAALADPGLDAVVVATPAHLHVPMAAAALRAGKHVLIEKPLAVGLEGTEQLTDLRDQSGLSCRVAYTYRSIATVLALKAFLQDSPFGQPLAMHVQSGQHFPHFRPAYRDIYFKSHETGGGAIQDGLTHLVHAAEWLIGPIEWVYCDASHQALEGVTVEDCVHLSARAGRAMLQFSYTLFQAPNEGLLTIHCAKGSMRIEFHRQRWGTMPLGEDVWTWRDAPDGERDDVFIAQAAAFLDAIEGKPCHLASVEEARQTLRVNIAALQSARSRQPVDLKNDIPASHRQLT